MLQSRAFALDDAEPRLRGDIERLETELAEARAQVARLEALAHEDPLTGLLNRRGFFRDLARAIAHRARYGTPVALLIADLDRFKPINDTYGHEMGDRALTHVAGVLKDSVRASDTVARLGGDEFALLLWHVDEPTGCQKGDALEEIVAARPLVCGSLTFPLAASIGCTILDGKDTPEEAMVRADQAMFEQKCGRRPVRR